MTFFWPAAVLIFLLGSAVGSFLNVLIYRTIHREDWIKSRSRCETCRQPIAWYENVPIFSYLYLRGRCSRCQASISPIHPTMELLTGSLFLWWYVEGWPLFLADAWLMSVIQPLFWLLVGVIGVAIIISDLQELIIPRWSVLLLTLLALAYRLVSVLVGEMQATDLWWSLVWSALLVLFFFLLWSVTRGRGFGFGDVQLAFPLGLLLGSWQRIVVGIWLAFLIGALVGLGLILVKRKRFGQVVPFAPFLLLGTALSLRWGYQLWTAYVKLIAG